MTLRLGDIDFRKKPVTPQLFLCRPNKMPIAKLNEAYNISFDLKLGALNELKFTLPVFIEKHHEMIRNENVDTIKGRYIVKLVLNKYEEYFMVNTMEKAGSGDGEELNITMLSLGFELNDKIIRDYKEQSKTATELLIDILKDTIWTIGYVDSEFDLKRRACEVSSNTALEVVFDLAKTFNALVVWDTLNRKVSFVKPDLFGLDKGFKIKYGKYLESLNQEENSEEVITRFKMYGKENKTIREINPTGTNYIEDFSYFIYPYKEEKTATGYNVLTHSDYMSDELCHALIAYDKLIQDNKDVFAGYIAERESLQGILDTKNADKLTLNTELKILLDERDVLNTRISKMEDDIDHADNNKQSTVLLKSDLEGLRSQLNTKLLDIQSKKGQISSKEAEIVVAENNLQGTLDKINALKSLLDVTKNFTADQLSERNQFIIEKEWQDNNIDNTKDLLKEGTKVFYDLYSQQKITLKVGIVNFLSMISEQINWDKLGLGDIIHIEHERLQVSYTAKITEIQYDFEGSTINITISNVKDVLNRDKFLDMIYKSYGTSTQVTNDSWKWDLSMENKGSINEIINNIWDANKQAIIGAKDQVIEISDRGLIIRDPNDPNTYLVGLNGMIAITNDGGNTWKHAITGTGIVGERIYGKVIMGVNLAIEDEHGIVKWQGSLGEIFDRNKKLVMKMGLVAENPDTFGLWSFNDITRVKMDDKVGFAIEKATTDKTTYPDGWRKIFWADQVDGTIYSHGLVAENIKIVNDIGKTILDAETNYLDLGDFQKIVMDNKFTTLEKLQVITELYQIESSYKRVVEQANKYKTSQRDDAVNTASQTLTKTASTTDLYSTVAVTNAYNALFTYMETFIKVTTKDPLSIDVHDPLTEKTSPITDRAEFILKFKTYYDEERNLRNKIQDAQFYSSMNMGQFYNNIVMGEFGLIALRNDGKYRAFLNATNGLALQKWQTDRWVNKVYASIGNSTYEDGTLIAEDLVAKRLRIETTNGGVLLDATSLSIDFTVLDSIVLDDVIMSPEKIILSNQLKSLSKQYTTLKEQITRYTTTIYSDRDSTYLGLDTAKTELVTAGDSLTTSYNALNTYLTPVFVNMNAKTHIVNDLSSTRAIFHQKWEDFYKDYESARSKLADFLEKSSLQLGRNYNNTVIDAQNGIVVTRGNMMNRTTLNATDGIKIEQNVGTPTVPSWVKRFWVDLDGKLFAEELQAKALRILDGTLGTAILFDATNGITINGLHGEVIRLNANQGIALDVNGQQRLWIDTDGTLRARKLIIMDGDVPPVKLPDGSFISQLTVSALRTLEDTNPQDYVYVKDQYVKFISGNGSGTDEEKMKIYLDAPSGSMNGIPVIKMGAGSSPTFADNEVGYIIKDQDAWKFNYRAMNGNLRRLWFTRGGTGVSEGIIMESIGNVLKLQSDTSIRLEINANNYIEITPTGVKIVGTRIDFN